MLLKTSGYCDVDLLAARLTHLGLLARSMPIAWDGAAILHPVATPDGKIIGRMLPGRGLQIEEDLQQLGVKKRLPGVYERSMVRRLIDSHLGNERGAISTYDGILTARSGGKAFDVVINKSFNATSGVWQSTFRGTGSPTTGTYTNIPTGAALDNTNAGAWTSLLSNPSGSDKKYLIGFGAGCAGTHTWNCMMLVDLLVAAGNIDANSSTTQTINSAALTRYTSGAGVMMTFDVTTVLGSTPANLTVSAYHNQAGTGSQTTAAIAMTTTAAVQRLQPVEIGPWMRLASGDYGVQSVESLIFSAAMGGSGKVALNLYYPLLFMPGLGAGSFHERDSTSNIDGLVELTTASQVLGCLTTFAFPAATQNTIFCAFMRTVDG